MFSQDAPVLVAERRQRVLDLISKQGFSSLADLAQAIDASESTLRRDLDFWDKQGILKRTHGGAIFLGDGAPLPPLEERSTRQLDEKRLIAQTAADRIRDGDSVLLDGGTTTLELAKLLVGRSLQIVTNSLPIATLCASSRDIDLVMLGGYVFPKTGVALGPLTVKMLDDVHVQQAVMSCGGITAKGLFNSNLLLVETQRRMISCADEVVLLADHTKLGRQALSFFCDLSSVDTLIVDRELTPEQLEWIEQAGIRLILGGTPAPNEFAPRNGVES